MDRKQCAIRPLESQERTGVLNKEGSEFQKFHGERMLEEDLFGRFGWGVLVRPTQDGPQFEPARVP